MRRAIFGNTDFSAKPLILLALALSCRSESQPRVAVARPDSSKSTASSAAPATPDTTKLRIAVNPEPKPAPPPAVPKADTPRTFRGLYYRNENDSSFFQPCGDRRSYQLVGRGDALWRLRQHYRFTAVYIGRPLFAAMQGHFQDDSMKNAPEGDKAAVVRRFFITRLDTLRARGDGDCRGVRSASQ